MKARKAARREIPFGGASPPPFLRFRPEVVVTYVGRVADPEDGSFGEEGCGEAVRDEVFVQDFDAVLEPERMNVRAGEEHGVG